MVIPHDLTYLVHQFKFWIGTEFALFFHSDSDDITISGKWEPGSVYGNHFPCFEGNIKINGK